MKNNIPAHVLAKARSWARCDNWNDSAYLSNEDYEASGGRRDELCIRTVIFWAFADEGNKKINWCEGAVSSSIMERPPLGRKHQLVSRAHPSTRQDHSSTVACTQYLRSQGQMRCCTALRFQRTLRCIFLAVLLSDGWNFHWFISAEVMQLECSWQYSCAPAADIAEGRSGRRGGLVWTRIKKSREIL